MGLNILLNHMEIRYIESNTIWRRFCLLMVASIVVLNAMRAQNTAEIVLVYDGNIGTRDFKELLKSEIRTLLSQQFELVFNEFSFDDLNQKEAGGIEELFVASPDALITLGFNSSAELQNRVNYPIPCIAGISIERSDRVTSGISNFTYVQSPFSIERDFEVFRSIYDFRKLGVFIRPDSKALLDPYLRSLVDGFELEVIEVSDDPMSDLKNLSPDIDALYFLPFFIEDSETELSFIREINRRKIPSFSLIGREDVEKGILASISPSDYIGLYARRIALNVMKILEGKDPKDFPVQITGLEDDFVINMTTMQMIEIYPSFEVLSQASYVGLHPEIGDNYTLKAAIAQALEQNLNLHVAQGNVDAQSTEIKIARANLFPDLSASTTLAAIDNSTAEQLKLANQLTPQTEWSGNIGLRQLLYSQQALANVSIQNSLLKSEEAGLETQQLDLILDVCTSYLQYLQARANLSIQNNNVQTTLKNLNIAKTREKIGSSSRADVYGFEAQLAIDKTGLNDAQTAVRNATTVFNQLLNRPLDRPFVLDELPSIEGIIFLSDSRVSERINNQFDFLEFAEFLVDHARRNAPELDQLRWLLQAQESSLGINQKSLYQPELALQGTMTQTLGRYGTKVEDEAFELLGIDPYRPTWNLGVNASLPIFQGNLRRNKIQRDKILIDQLEANREFLEQNIETRIRISLENLGNSYNDIQYTQQAEESSLLYLGVIQDLYKEGTSNIVTLLDAQSNALSSQLSAVSSYYQFLIDALTIERLYNNMYILLTDDERDKFINEYFAFILKKDSNE